jgi:hypothetical protein
MAAPFILVEVDVVATFTRALARARDMASIRRGNIIWERRRRVWRMEIIIYW